MENTAYEKLMNLMDHPESRLELMVANGLMERSGGRYNKFYGKKLLRYLRILKRTGGIAGDDPVFFDEDDARFFFRAHREDIEALIAAHEQETGTVLDPGKSEPEVFFACYAYQHTAAKIAAKIGLA